MRYNSYTLLFWTTVFTFTVCMLTIAFFSGFFHSKGKFRSMLVAVFMVVIFHYLVADPIRFILLSISAAWWPPQQHKFVTDAEASHHNRIDYLKLRLKTLRAQLTIPESHRDEKLNSKYKKIQQDLWLYGRYFIFVLALVMISGDGSAYYTKNNIQRLFTKNHTFYFGLDEVYEMKDAYDFITNSLINAFHSDVNPSEVSVWVHGEQTKMLGVVRLRQLRLTDENFSGSDPPFSEKSYLPKWKLPYEHLPYFDIYWRIYSPWLPKDFNGNDMLLLDFDHVGNFRSYPELKGYVALLARSQQNSLKIIEYLRENKWLNYNTSALFMDFTLYSTDANLLSVCTLRVEQTPFGSTIPQVKVESVTLLENLDQLSDTAIVLIIIYVIVFIQFFKALTVKLWFEPNEIRSTWNRVDIGIFLLNIVILALIIIREIKVSLILKHLESESKMEYVEVKQASRLHMFIRVLIGFLICITTLRLWKALQFSRVFQLFAYTLYLSWGAVASVAIVICVFILGFGAAVSTINGNNSFNFSRLSKSIVTCTCFAFGFSVGVDPVDLFHGGKILGIILFSILAFVITVMLINIFVSLINDYFSTAKDQRDTRAARRINIFQFMYAECSYYFLWWERFRFFRKYYKRKNRTVSENITRDLKSLIKNIKRWEGANTFVVEHKISQLDLNLELDEYNRHQERIYTIGALINTQIDLLESL